MRRLKRLLDETIQAVARGELGISVEIEFNWPGFGLANFGGPVVIQPSPTHHRAVITSKDVQ